MKSNLKHILTEQWTRRLAADIERAFFRIERENRLLSAIVNGCIAGAAVAIVSWLVVTLKEGDLILFACLGSSSASVVFAPLSRHNSLRTIVTAYFLAAIVCLLLFPVHRYTPIPLPIQCFLAVSIPVFAMRLLDTMHPAAIGSALSFIIYDRDMQSIFLLLLAIVGLLTIVKVLAYIYLEDLTFRDFTKEFRQHYYGKEMTITIVNSEESESKPSADT